MFDTGFSWNSSDVVRDVAMFLDQQTAYEVINGRGELLRIRAIDGRVFTIDVREDREEI